MTEDAEWEDATTIAGFEFDEANLGHMAAHGLDANIVWDVWADEPVLVPRIGRSGTLGIVRADVEHRGGARRRRTRHLATGHRLGQHGQGEEDVARKKMTRQEEAALAAETEKLRDDEAAWDYGHARSVGRGGSPSAVLSVRVSIEQIRALRKLAAVEGMSLSDLMKDAVASYVASAGPQVSSSGPRQLQLNLKRSSRSETMQPGAHQLRDAGPSPYRPDTDTETTIAS